MRTEMLPAEPAYPRDRALDLDTALALETLDSNAKLLARLQDTDIAREVCALVQRDIARVRDRLITLAEEG